MAPDHEERRRLRIGVPVPEALGKLHEGRCCALRHRLPGLAGPQPLRVGHRLFELLADRAVGEVVERELVRRAYGVRPFGANAESHHVRDDWQRRVFQRKQLTAAID